MNADKDKATPTPRPWHRDEYGHVRGPEGEMICLTGFSLATGHVPRDSQPYHNDALVFAAVNSWDAHRQLVDIVRLEHARNNALPCASCQRGAAQFRAALAACDAVEKP